MKIKLWKCKDCGEQDKEAEKGPISICDDCWELRIGVIKKMNDGELDILSFEKYQIALREQSYRGPNIAKEILGITLAI